MQRTEEINNTYPLRVNIKKSNGELVIDTALFTEMMLCRIDLVTKLRTIQLF